MTDIRYTIRRAALTRAARRLPYEKMARAVLGDEYELSLVVCGDDLGQRLNYEHRSKTYKPNVLSFPISKKEGEIFLNAPKAAREARAFGVPLEERLALLFVHGCFHLKGLKHGRIMEGRERQTLRRFEFTWHGTSTVE